MWNVEQLFLKLPTAYERVWNSPNTISSVQATYKCG